jgi:AraC-like DNA-binding protein
MAVRSRIALQRVGILAGLPSLMTSLGLDESAVFSELGVDAEDLRPDNRIPYFLFLHLLNRAVDATGCEHLGLLLGASQPYTALGPVGRLMGVSADLGAALSAFALWHVTASNSAAASVEVIDGSLRFGYGIYEDGSADASALYDCAIAFGNRAVRDLTGRADVVREAWICHRRPNDEASYREILGVPVSFDRPHSDLVMAPESTSIPLPGADPEAAARLERELSGAYRSVLGDDAVRLRHAMRPLILGRRATPAEAARRLGTSPDTLQHRLLRDGTSFERIREEVTHAVACELVAFTDMPLADIASALSFDGQTAFDGFFREYTGVSPRTWRTARA